jgi:hypothetical protein
VDVDIEEINLDHHNPLSWAAYSGKYDICQVLLDAGANPRYQMGGNGKTSLHNATIRGHLNICELLLAQDSTLIDIKDDKGMSPIQIAISTNTPESLLIKQLFTACSRANIQRITGMKRAHFDDENWDDDDSNQEEEEVVIEADDDDDDDDDDDC